MIWISQAGQIDSFPDLYDLHDLHDLNDLYDLYDLACCRVGVV